MNTLISTGINKFRYWLYRLHFNHPELFNHRPIHLDLEINRSCNLKCPFCYRQAAGFAKRFPDKIMWPEDAGNYLAEYYKKGYRSVKFNWRGEPLLHPSLGVIASKAKRLGYLDVMINTNLAVKTLPTTFLANLDSFTEIRVSLDTMMPELYAKMRVGGKLETTLTNLAQVIKKYNPKKTRLIIQRRTNEQTENNFDFFMKLSGELTQISLAISIKFDIYNKIISKPVQPRNLKIGESYFSKWHAGLLDRQYCKQPSQRTVIGVDGEKFTCCLAYLEPEELNIKNRIKLIAKLKDDFIEPYHTFNCRCTEVVLEDDGFCLPNECYACTSFTAYKEKQ